MDEKRAARLREKYAAGAVGQPKKVLDVGRGGGRARAMSAQGKPKNLLGTMNRLLRYLGKERGLIVLAAFFALAFSVSSLTASYMLRPIINRFLAQGAAGGELKERSLGLALSLGILAGVYLTSVLCQWLQQRIMLSVSQRSLCRMRRELFDHLQTLPVSYFDNHGTGDIMSRFANDVDAVGEMLNTTLIQMISGSVTIAGTVGLMLYTNVILGTITILFTPLLAAISRRIMKTGQKAYARQQRNLGALNGFAQETITGQKVVKVFNHEGAAMEEFSYLNRELMKAQIRAQFHSGIMGPITHQICNMGYAVTAGVGAALVVFRGFDLGGLTVSVNYTRQFNRPINEISMQMNNVFSALAGAERVFQVLDEKPEEEARDAICPESIRGHVVLDHVNFGYRPGQTILHDISLQANPGQKIAFVGSTGAGKTTVTNLLSRFYEIQEGKIEIDGIPIEKNQAGLPAQKYCHGASGHPPVYGNGEGKYPLRKNGGHEPGGGGGGKGSLGPFLYHPSGAWLRHGSHPGRRQPVPGPEAAVKYRQGSPFAGADPDPGRGHQLGGHADGAADPGGDGCSDAEPHHLCDCPPAVNGAQGGSDPGAGGRANHSAGNP